MIVLIDKQKKQHHDQIVTSQDVGLALRCSYQLQNYSLSSGLDLSVASRVPTVAEESTVVPPPIVVMNIAIRNGDGTNTAQVRLNSFLFDLLTIASYMFVLFTDALTSIGYRLETHWPYFSRSRMLRRVLIRSLFANWSQRTVSTVVRSCSSIPEDAPPIRRSWDQSTGRLTLISILFLLNTNLWSRFAHISSKKRITLI